VLDAQGLRQISFAAGVRQEGVAIAAAFFAPRRAECQSSRYDGGHDRVDKLQGAFAEAGFAPQ